MGCYIVSYLKQLNFNLMKILFVLHCPPPVHGSSIVGLQIKESKIINEAFSCKYINLGTSKTIEEIGKKRVVKFFRYLAILFQIFWNVILNRPDLCYFSITAKDFPFYKDASLALLVKAFGIRIIYHFHNKGVSLRKDKYVDDLLYRLTFKNSIFILLSKYLYPDIQKYVIKEHVYYCPNGMPDENVICNKKDESNVVELLFLSTLMESKGIFVLLEVCRILQQKNLVFNCTIVGGTGDVSEQLLRSKLYETDLINYVGEKNGKEKEDVFAKTDIFIHPTFEDCFPLVLLEAMQHSLPVVSTFEGGIIDIVENGKTGYLVPQKDPEALAEKLEYLIRNPDLRKQMGSAGRLKFEREFTLEKFELRLKEILQKVTENK